MISDKGLIPKENIEVPKKNWFSFLLTIHNAEAFRQLLLSMIMVGVYSAILQVMLQDVFSFPIKVEATMHSILGITLGLLLIIRTNTAYDRWWEGRQVVGEIIANIRLLSIRINTFIPENNKEDRMFFASMLSGFCFAVKEHLREGVKFEELAHIDDEKLAHLKTLNNVPNGILNYLARKFYRFHVDETITPSEFEITSPIVQMLSSLLAKCERIRTTPLPMAYSMHIKVFIIIYVVTLPIVLMNELQYWTAPAVMIIFYAMVGLELIGEEIEDPFGTDENDIPTDLLFRICRHNIYETLLPEHVEKNS